MELIACDVEACHLGFADLDALAIAAGVERAFDLEAGLGGGRSDQLDHGQAIRERPAAPVLRDMAEQPVLNLVPLRCAWRIVVDVDHEAAEQWGPPTAKKDKSPGLRLRPEIRRRWTISTTISAGVA